MSIVAVAKKAGVSVSTVARVLKGLPAVSDKTAKQVRRAISELGYKQTAVRRPRSDSASSVKRAVRSELAILSLADDSHWQNHAENAKAIEAIMDAAHQQGVDARVSSTTVQQLKNAQGAIVFVPPEADESKLKLLAAKLPLVCIMSSEPCQVRVDHILTDAAEVGRLACEHLRGGHCDHFAFLTDEPDSKLVQQYARGFARALTRSGKRIDVHLIGAARQLGRSFPSEAKFSSSMLAAVDKLCGEGPKLGVFAPHRLLATKACDALVAKGRCVGKDLVVVSCEGDDVAIASKRAIGLIALQSYLVGRLALQQLLHRIAHPSAPTVRVQVPVLLHP